MTIQELEKQVWEQDKVRIIIRDGLTTKVKEYTCKNAAQGNWRITQFVNSRIKPLVSGRDVVVVNGEGNIPHGATSLKTLRESYN